MCNKETKNKDEVFFGAIFSLPQIRHLLRRLADMDCTRTKDHNDEMITATVCVIRLKLTEALLHERYSAYNSNNNCLCIKF